MQAIVRHSKHHSLATLKAAASHTMRTRFTANANPDAPAPEVWVGSSDPAQDVASVLPEKRRKNAVLSLEYLVTASPEFFDQQPPDVWRKYLADQVDMLRSYYGKENVVSVVLHQDEKTPHLSVQVVPLVDGKLNARALVGTREACRIIQDLAGEAGQPYGVLRGTPRSKAKHQDVRQWYSELAPRIEGAKEIIAKATSIEGRAEKVEQWEAEVRERAKAVIEAEKRLAIEQRRIANLVASLTPIEEERAAQLLAQQAKKPPVQGQQPKVGGLLRPEPKTSPRSGFKPR